MNNRFLAKEKLKILAGSQKFIQFLVATLLALLAIEGSFFTFPRLVTAENNSSGEQTNKTAGSFARMINKDKDKNIPFLPVSKSREVKYKIRSVITAYNSEISQCSGDPCITANGYNVCQAINPNTVAANNLPLGTKVRIPELFGEKVFVVRDRMNSRYHRRIDVWMQEKKEAKKFGVKYATIQVLE